MHGSLVDGSTFLSARLRSFKILKAVSESLCVRQRSVTRQGDEDWGLFSLYSDVMER